MSSRVSHGTERELRVRDIASRLSVADFLFTCPPAAKGLGASREIGGDGPLIVDGVGAILQVKSRRPGEASSDTRARPCSWVAKNTSAAERQGNGTRREIGRRQAAGTEMTVM